MGLLVRRYLPQHHRLGKDPLCCLLAPGQSPTFFLRLLNVRGSRPQGPRTNGSYSATNTELFSEITEGKGSPGESGFVSLLGYYGSRGGNEVPGSCTQTHRQITLASDLASSLSFFMRSTLPSPPKPLRQIPINHVAYDPSKTYISFITSDGDNLAYDFGATRDLMAARATLCAGRATPKDCPPIGWTISPRLPDLAPAWVEWYYKTAHQTGADSFLFGPSGFGYLYPAQLSPADREAFAELTTRRAAEMDVSATVESENCCAGKHGTAEYTAARMDLYRLYNHSSIRGIFTGNIEAQVVGDVGVVSDPVVGYDPYAHVPLNATEAAAALNEMPRGTVTHVVVVVVAAQAQAMVNLSRAVAEHVQFVGHRELLDLQRQKFGR